MVCVSTFKQVNPNSLIDIPNHTPLHGRGAWSTAGIESDYRYYNDNERIGSEAGKSLAHWAVSAGVYGIQRVLIGNGYLYPLNITAWGVFGDSEEDAVRDFQADHLDPDGGTPLLVDGIVGRSDARALLRPMFVRFQNKHHVPQNFLVGQVAWESALDPGAVGYYIFYAGTSGTLEYRGVDRGLVQANSRGEVSWRQAYDPAYALNYSAKRMRTAFDGFVAKYPTRDRDVLWDAAIASHNSPLWASQWASWGAAPNEQILKYVNSVKNARF